MITPERIIPRKLASLKQLKFRSRFKLSQKDRDYITTKGLETIREQAFQFINSRVAPDFPRNDGKQTPRRGIRYLLLNMQRQLAAGNAFKNGMVLRRAGRWMKRRSILLWR